VPDQNAYQQAIGVALNDAKSMLGKNEVPDHAELADYLRTGGQNLDPHKLAWCAAFVSASLQKAGLPVPTQVVKDSAFGPGAYAPNYLTYGSPVDAKNIQAGDILVANNGGHVGFAEGPMRQGPNGPEVQLLAGNEAAPSGQYAPGSYTNPNTGAVANRSQVGMVGERWVPLSQYSARRYEPDANATSATTANAAPAQPPGTTINSTSVIDQLSRNIAQIESGGSANPYGIIQSRTGAVGKYQVMPVNVGPWTQQAIGRAETPDEFRKDTAAQEAVFRDQASRALQTMSPQDFASTWFTGKPYSAATAGASDYTGTTNRNYVMRATQGIDNADKATGAAVAATPGTTVNTTAGGYGNVLPGFSDQQGKGFLGGLSQLDKAAGGKGLPGYGGDDSGAPDMKPLPIGPAPGARNVSPLLPYASSMAKALAQQAQATPQWSGQAPGQNPYANAGLQQPYGTSLSGLQQLHMLIGMGDPDPFSGSLGYNYG
jgi:hypothetical protein